MEKCSQIKYRRDKCRNEIQCCRQVLKKSIEKKLFIYAVVMTIRTQLVKIMRLKLYNIRYIAVKIEKKEKKDKNDLSNIHKSNI